MKPSLMKIYIRFCFLVFIIFSCDKEDDKVQKSDNESFVKAMDLSFLPEIENENVQFYDIDGTKNDVLSIVKKYDVNVIRLRLWHTPSNFHSSLKEVVSFSKKIKQMGLKIWLTVHYSDTWADPAHQSLPQKWQNLSYNSLKDSVLNYTNEILMEIQPDYIQIGNEINNGFLFPHGNLYENEIQFVELVSSISKKIRQHDKNTKIIIHYAGINGANWFFDKLQNIDYDIIGISYYPIWHGKSLVDLSNTVFTLGNKHQKDIIIAETAYPFTLSWNDWTNNIVGLEEQLILPDFPATPDGQKLYLNELKNIIKTTKYGKGFCYWGAEWVAFKGSQAINGSSWENQTVFDFENKALPVLEIFKE
jgi:arabinogalactan endo-1,4-beta-galactosidase